MAKIDPRITSELSALKANDTMKVAASFDVASNKSDSIKKILEEIEVESKQRPRNSKFYDNLDLVILEADHTFINKLIEHSNLATLSLVKDDDVYKLG